MKKLASVVAALALLGGCSDEPKEKPTPVIVIDAASDTSSDTASDAGADVDDDTLTADSVCDELGYEPRPFEQASAAQAFGDLAGDFTVETTRGEFQLSVAWTGCDSYIFINHYPSDYGDQLFAGSIAELLERSAPNVHYFFAAYADSDDAAAAKTGELEARLAEALDGLDSDDADHWRNRVHLVTQDVRGIDGSVGEFLSAQNNVSFALGIDRTQRFEQPGSLMRIGFGGFQGDLAMAGYVPRYYNYAYDLDEHLAAEADVTVVPLLDGEAVTENHQVYSATFPDAQAMAGFDTLEIDVRATCGPSPQDDCGEWDYSAYLRLCANEDCSETHEIARYITPYSRPGTRRWIIEATPFLGLLREGGEQSFKFGMYWNMNPNTMDLSFRLSDRGHDTAPTEVVPVFSSNGDAFDDTYNERWTPQTFTPPADAAKVELVAIVSGHGQDDGNNCAEWCNHQHQFTVNDATPHKLDYPGEAGQPLGCAEKVDEGVVPGQWGNWAPGRAAWCPGLPVQPWVVDITDEVELGGSNTLGYEGLFDGDAPAGGSIRLDAYLVYSK